ncbi:MAG: c-type cytochrome domain-containing protein, partial [Aureliella sp.]
MSVRRLSFAWLGLLLAISTTPGFAVDYGKDIAPLWKRSCVACHNSKKAEGGLNLESGANLLKESDSGVPVVAGKSGESELLARITATDDTIMPPKDNSAGAKPLTPAEIELVKQWIDAGAVPSEEGIPTTIAWQAVPGSIRPVYAVDASADGQFIAAGRGNQVVVYTWPLKTAQPAAVALIDPQTASSAGAPAAHLDLVQSLAFSPDAQTLVTGGYRCVKFWRRDFAPTSLAALQSSAGIIAASPSGKSLAMARDDKTVEIIDLATKTVKFVLPAAQGKIGTIAWTLDDQALFVADESKTVTRWQLPAADAPATTAPAATSFAAPAAVKALAPLARDRVALLSADGQVSLFVEEAPATPAPQVPAAAAPAAAAEKPAAEKPAEEKPAADKPAAEKPEAEKPAADPAPAQPAAPA